MNVDGVLCVLVEAVLGLCILCEAALQGPVLDLDGHLGAGGLDLPADPVTSNRGSAMYHNIFRNNPPPLKELGSRLCFPFPVIYLTDRRG